MTNYTETNNIPVVNTMKYRARKELLICIILAAFFWSITHLFHIELVESIYFFTREHEDWELDEFIFAFFWVAIVSTLYGLRRVSDIKSINSEIINNAYFDSLTGLPNRSLGLNHLEQELSKAKRYSRKIIVSFIDLDNFKHINDSYGHNCGDRLIQEVANRLNNATRESDVVARLGGDEFIIISEYPDDNGGIARLVERIQQCQDDSLYIDGEDIALSFSTGIATYPKDGTDLQSLLIAADNAMYEAKKNKNGSAFFYQDQLGARVAEHYQLSSRLRTAISNNEVYMVYQPIIDNELGIIKGYESLIRWKLDGRMINPEHLIQIAEEIGFDDDILRWTLERILSESQVLLKDEQFLAVNITPKQFISNGLVSIIRKAADAHSFDLSKLEVEITEHSLMNDFNISSKRIGELNDIGVKTMIDDFGMGYSSLSRLKNLNVSKLKIDRSFLAESLQDHKSYGIYCAIVNLSRNLGIEIVSEGVETKEHVSFLKQFSPLYLQGYYFQKPARVNEQTIEYSFIEKIILLEVDEVQ